MMFEIPVTKIVSATAKVTADSLEEAIAILKDDQFDLLFESYDVQDDLVEEIKLDKDVIEAAFYGKVNNEDLINALNLVRR